MTSALIGYTGFVGNTLLKQRNFDSLYRSTNIHEIHDKKFNLVVCAGAPAQKWLANKDPVQDLKNINQLINSLKKIETKQFILISTVDVFKSPNNVNEKTFVDKKELHAYGLHRRLLEEFVQEQFKEHLIIRLPGLVGPGLRKNLIYDFLNQNNLHLIEGKSIFQFYPMVNLWFDIKIALKNKLSLIHLTAEPIETSVLAKNGFDINFNNSISNQITDYNMQTLYAKLFGVEGLYQYSQKETIQAVRTYAQSEPKRKNQI